MSKRPFSVLFLGKGNDTHCQRALSFCRSVFESVEAHLGAWGDPLPEACGAWEGDFVFSYLSRWVVPEPLLMRARRAAINYHPGSPDYPGIGCVNFALYDGAPEFGVTCHHMAGRVDTGEIIAVKRFPVFSTDDVASLLARTYDFQLTLFYEVTAFLLGEGGLPVSSERWTRRPYTRREVDQLSTVTSEMTAEEIARRARATTFGPFRPTLVLHGRAFELRTDPSS